MSAFDKIIGCSTVKKELRQIADTLKNRDAYKKLGVSSPRGLLLHGEPGVGKSLMASAIIEASGRKSFLCRKDQPNGDFIKHIKKTFEQAMENAPSIVLLDDMDKFANGDERHPDSEEYVTVQSCIDNAKGKEVFILATVNNMRCLPKSLYRPGRFDRVIEIKAPRGNDAVQIIDHYLKSKEVMSDVDAKAIARIMDGHSCAMLETVINEAGLYAGYERADMITMDHLLEACLRILFHIPMEADDEEDFSKNPADSQPTISQIVYHEAGHAVISELLCPESVTLVSVYNRGHDKGGFTEYYDDGSYETLYWARSRIIASLGGPAANEQRFGVFDTGCQRDLEYAFSQVKSLATEVCINGFHLYNYGYGENSEQLKAAHEHVIAGEVEGYYRKAKEILSLNAEYLEKVAIALAQKKLLSTIDMQNLKKECKIVPVAL